MGFTDLVLLQEDAVLIDQCLFRFLEDTSVTIALLMSRDGHLICRQGDCSGIQMESLCALAVGSFVSSEALARLAGESTFNSIFHQGMHSNVYISLVGDEHLLLSLFDYHSSAPIVRLQAKVFSESVVLFFERAYARTRKKT